MDTWDRSEVKMIVREVLEGYFKTSVPCPECKTSTTFVVAGYAPDEDEVDYGETWRCLRCLKLFKQVMAPIEK